MEQIIEKVCGTCGSPAKFKKGISQKNNKEWKGYFCQNKDCKSVDWIQDTPQNSQNAPTINSGGKADVNPNLILADEVTSLRTQIESLDKFIRGKFN